MNQLDQQTDFQKENFQINKQEEHDKDELSTKDWYWSKISRAQANDLLQGTKDGTFLVRDSTNNKNDKTLTVKKDGINKMIRIICKNGKYGFGEPIFDSIQSLIDSLSEYYPEMNIKLEYPLSKTGICSSLDVTSANNEDLDIELLKLKFKTAEEEYLLAIEQYEEYLNEYKNCQYDIKKIKQSLNCFEETFAIFEEQIKLNEENRKEAMPHEVSILEEHRLDIEDKLAEIKEFKLNLEKQCEETNIQSVDCDRRINELKPQLNEKKRIREQMNAILINKVDDWENEYKMIYSKMAGFSGLENQFVNENNYDHNQPLNYSQLLLNNDYLCKSMSASINSPIESSTSTFPTKYYYSNLNKLDDQNDESNYLDNFDFNKEQVQSSIDEWYVGDLKKEDINIILKDQPDGTFLVRDSSNIANSPYTLTVRVNGANKLIRVFKSKDNRYGFQLEKLEFESLTKLINHHLKEPLVVINSDLTIRLEYPITRERIQKYLTDKLI